MYALLAFFFCGNQLHVLRSFHLLLFQSAFVCLSSWLQVFIKNCTISSKLSCNNFFLCSCILYIFIIGLGTIITSFVAVADARGVWLGSLNITFTGASPRLLWCSLPITYSCLPLSSSTQVNNQKDVKRVVALSSNHFCLSCAN